MESEFLSKLHLNPNIYNLAKLGFFGESVYISGNVEIMRPWNVVVGNNVMIDSYFFCTTGLCLGDYIHIGPHCSVCGGEQGYLQMHHFSGMSSGCRIVTGSDDFSGGTGLRNPTIPEEYRCNLTIKAVVFEPFCTLGTNSVVLPGVTLAIGSCVGANSLVTKSTQPWTFYFGSPAKKVCSIPKDTILEYAKQMGYDF